MKELKIEQVSKTYGTKTLLDKIDWAIRTGDRIGLIGPNGTGKSSFLKVLAGIDNYDDGIITKPNHYSIAYLAQAPQLDPQKTILESVYDAKVGPIQVLLQYEQARKALEKDPENQAKLADFSRLSDKMTQDNIWDIEVKAKTILSQLQLKDLDQLIGRASGGEQKRVALAQVLIASPDLLILDEPTNHLDIESVQWLETYLSTYSGALLLVTHDRYFLERSVNKIVELRFGKLTTYEGNYQAYLEKRANQAILQEKLQDKEDKLFQQELAWMRKGAKARTTKQQARIDRFHDLKSDIQNRNKAQDAIDLDFKQQRIGNRVLDLERASIRINDQLVVKDLTKSFVKGDRLGIIGPNGIGKSTFLNTIAGLHSLDEGVLELGQTVRLAYYRQMDQDLPGDVRVLTYLTKIADNFKREDGSFISAAQLLEQFNFPRNTHGNLIGTLSGGEKRRLYLLSLLVQEPNVLLLDEPTNDLDIDTLTVLEDYLTSFNGLVMVVSHDRYFLDKTVDLMLVLEGDGAHSFVWGNYSDYLEQTKVKKQALTKEAESRSSNVPVLNKEKSKRRLSYQEKKEFESLPGLIEKAEIRLDQVNALMVEHGSDLGKLVDLQKELDQLETDLMTYYERQELLQAIVDEGDKR
ncbi:TPA: ABC-F family ATP-binding cassette domain-containing protein [Streptococcus suis]